MLNWTMSFLMIAIVAAIFGFGGIASTAVEMAKVIFYIFLILFAVSFLIGILTGRGTPKP